MVQPFGMRPSYKKNKPITRIDWCESNLQLASEYGCFVRRKNIAEEFLNIFNSTSKCYSKVGRVLCM